MVLHWKQIQPVLPRGARRPSQLLLGRHPDGRSRVLFDDLLDLAVDLFQRIALHRCCREREKHDFQSLKEGSAELPTTLPSTGPPLLRRCGQHGSRPPGKAALELSPMWVDSPRGAPRPHCSPPKPYLTALSPLSWLHSPHPPQQS